VHDRDSAFHAWTTTAAALGIQEVVTAPAQPTCCSGRVRSRRLRCPRLAPPRQSFRPAVQQRKLPRRSIRRNRWSLCHRCRSWYRARHRSCSAPARSRCRRFCRHVIFTLPHALLETKTSAAVCAPRKGIVEPVTGQIKQARSFRQFLLRWLRAGPRGNGRWCARRTTFSSCIVSASEAATVVALGHAPYAGAAIAESGDRRRGPAARGSHGVPDASAIGPRSKRKSRHLLEKRRKGPFILRSPN
jgi:hypothetical protein